MSWALVASLMVLIGCGTGALDSRAAGDADSDADADADSDSDTDTDTDSDTDSDSDTGSDTGPDADVDVDVDADSDSDSDSDPAPAVCGNGIVEGEETCDPCPESCDDDSPCTIDDRTGDSATCDVVCEYTPTDELCYAVDVDVAGNLYSSDPDADGESTDNALETGAIDRCISLDVAEFPTTHTIDIVGRHLEQASCTQVRFQFDPDLVQVQGNQHTPFTDFAEPVGFLNLPFDPEAVDERRLVLEINAIENPEGDALLAACMTGERTDFVCVDQPHAPDAVEPYDASAPEGAVLTRVTLELLAASDGELVEIDLVNPVGAPNLYMQSTPRDTIVGVPDENLLDATIAVNRRCP